MARYWEQFVQLFVTFEEDMTRFRLWIARDEKEVEDKRLAAARASAGGSMDGAAPPLVGAEASSSRRHSSGKLDLVEGDEEEDAAEAEEEEAGLAELSALDDAAEDAVWDLLENYIFFISFTVITGAAPGPPFCARSGRVW